MKFAVSALAFGLFLALAARADDPIAGELEAARAVFAAQLEDSQGKLLSAIDEEIKKAAKSGSLDAVKSLQQEKAAIEADSSYESKATRLRPAIVRYRSETKAARDKLRTVLVRAVTEYTKAMKIAEAESIDAELKMLDKTGTIPAAKKPKERAKPPELKSGLIVSLFDRQPSQQGDTGYVEPEKLGNPASPQTVIESLEGWQFNAEKNAVASGFLRIDQPGEYRFRTYSFYDRNALFIAGQVICPYRGSVAGGSEPADRERINLDKGFIPIAVIGYVDSRGSVAVTWMPPGQKDYLPIPKELLFHDPKAINQQR